MTSNNRSYTALAAVHMARLQKMTPEEVRKEAIELSVRLAECQVEVNHLFSVLCETEQVMSVHEARNQVLEHDLLIMTAKYHDIKQGHEDDARQLKVATRALEKERKRSQKLQDLLTRKMDEEARHRAALREYEQRDEDGFIEVMKWGATKIRNVFSLRNRRPRAVSESGLARQVTKNTSDGQQKRPTSAGSLSSTSSSRKQGWWRRLRSFSGPQSFEPT